MLHGPSLLPLDLRLTEPSAAQHCYSSTTGHFQYDSFSDRTPLVAHPLSSWTAMA